MLVALSVQGFGNAMRNTGSLQTFSQYLMTVSQFGYAALGVVVVLVRFVSRRWLRVAWMAWAVCFVTAIALIPAAWIGSSYLQTLRFALVGVGAAVLVSLLVLCGAYSVLRPIAART